MLVIIIIIIDNRPETVNMKISNKDGVNVTVTTRAVIIVMNQGKCTPRRDRDSEVEAEVMQAKEILIQLA